jgi:hypothetical protein
MACWALILPVVALAQQFEVEPSQIPGIEVIPPGTPEFMGQIVTVIPVAAQREVLQPILPYSFIVRYGGKRKIQTMTVRYELTSAGGKKPVHASFLLRFLQKSIS